MFDRLLTFTLISYFYGVQAEINLTCQNFRQPLVNEYRMVKDNESLFRVMLLVDNLPLY